MIDARAVALGSLLILAVGCQALPGAPGSEPGPDAGCCTSGAGGAGGTWGGSGGSPGSWGGGGAGGSWGNAGTGVVTGGAQDFGFVRSQIQAGKVPQPESFAIEGLFAEHDLPVATAPCTALLCLSTAQASTEAPDGGQEHWIQLGMASNIDPTSFQRPQLDLALIVDKSCSMSSGNLVQVKAALHELVAQLNANDTVAIFEFDQTAQQTLVRTVGSNAVALNGAIDGIQIGGSTCIECGLRLGLDDLATLPPSASRERRVILLTDAIPNVGGTSPTDFFPLLESHAQGGRHVTTMGVGLDFGAAFISKLGNVHGANFVFLDQGEIETAFHDDFPFLVSPLAYDLTLGIDPDPTLRFEAMYGVPALDPASATREATVGTLFLSRTSSGGAMVARLSGPPPSSGQLGSLSIGWTDLQGATHSTALTAAAPAGPAPAYSDVRVAKTVGLARFVDAAKEACRLHWAGDHPGAVAAADAAIAVLLDAKALTHDAALDAELALANALKALVAAAP